MHFIVLTCIYYIHPHITYHSMFVTYTLESFVSLIVKRILFFIKYVMLDSTRMIDCVWCVQIIGLNLHLAMQQIVMMIPHVMENLVFLMLDILPVVSREYLYFFLPCHISFVLHKQYGNVHWFQYVMLVSTKKEGPVYCVQMTGSKLHLVMPQNVIALVMQNLILLMMSTLHVVRQLLSN